MPPTSESRLIEVIRKVCSIVRKYRQQGLGEQNTKATLIDPVVRALDWDTEDPDEVHREFRHTGRYNPVDYALKLIHRPRLFLEAKGLGENLSDGVGQVLGYAVVAGVRWCVLSDGDEYRFYNASEAIPAEEKMFCRVRLTEVSEQEAANILSLMSRGNLEQSLLDTLWDSHYVDRRVNAALREIFAAPAKSVVRLVKRQIPKLPAKEIADSIQRLNIHFDTVAVMSDVARRPARLPTAGMKTKRSGQRAATHRGPSVSLRDVISAGLLKAPTRLFRKYKKHDLEATLLPGGQMEFQGQPYDSCSTAAEVARETVTGRRMNTNGWVFWQYLDADGKRCILDKARRACGGGETGKVQQQPPIRSASGRKK